MNIGWIGTGIMGSRMAGHLLAAGHTLHVYNRTPEKAAELVAQGAQLAATPAAAAQHADCVFTVLAHPQAVEAVALDAATGLLGALRRGALWVDCSTVNPAFARRMAAQAEARGVRFLDAPVAGSKPQAAQAALVFLVGGDAPDVDACRELFAVMGSRVVHVGGHGMGISLKLIFNHMLGATMLAFAEGMRLGEALGLPQPVLLDALLGSAIAPPFLAGKREKFASGEYPADFPLQWMQKDMQMVSEAAYAAGTPMPLANATKEIYRLAMQQGWSAADFSAIYAYLGGSAEPA